MINRKALPIYGVWILLLPLISIFYFFTHLSLAPEISMFITFFLILISFFVYFIGIKNHQIPFSLASLITISFILKSYYAYNTYTTMISPFPDSFGYLDNLNKLTSFDSSYLLDFGFMEMTVGTSQFFYYYILYFMDTLFDNTFSFYLLNILLGSIALTLLYLIVHKDFGKKIAITTSIVATLSMTISIFTSNILKDSLVLFLTMLIYYLYKVSDKRHLILIVFLIGCLTSTRIYAGLSVLAAIGIDMLLNKHNFKKKISKIIAVSILLLFIFIAFNFSFLSRYMSLGERFISGYSIIDIVTIIPNTLFSFIFEPYPWGVFAGNHTIYSFMQIDSALAMMFSFSLIMFLYKFLKSKELRAKMYFYIFPIIMHSVALGIAYGGGLRQKIGAISFIILIFVVGLFYKREKQP